MSFIKWTASQSSDVLGAPLAYGSIVTECVHCGWRGFACECERDEDSLPIEARCPFCRRDFICSEADAANSNRNEALLGNWLEAKLSGGLSFR